MRLAVLGRAALRGGVEPAVLPGYRRVLMRKRTYPVVVPDAASRVSGVLMRGLARADFAKLLAYETDEYRVADVEVTTGSGKPVAAKVFVAADRAQASAVSWDVEDWRRRYKRAFLRRLRRGVTADRAAGRSTSAGRTA